MVATPEQVFREEWGRVLATLIGFLGDFDLAEEAAQEAFAMAADRWPRDGVPSNPRAWLMRTARNRATDRIRRDRALATKFGLLVAGNRAEVPMNPRVFPDERLERFVDQAQKGNSRSAPEISACAVATYGSEANICEPMCA